MKARTRFLSACVVLALSTTAYATGPTTAAPAISDEARTHFKAGVTFLQDPDGARYEEAYREFKEAYRISPSWKILGNLGLSSFKLERNGEAIDAYEKYLAQGGKEIDPGERAQVERDLGAMKAASATVTLTAKNAGGDATISDQRSRSTGGAIVNVYTLADGKPLALRVQAGHHILVARSGTKETRWESDFTGEQKVAHELSFDADKVALAPVPTSSASATTPPPAPPTSSGGTSTVRTAGFITAGVGGAMLIGGVITGIIGKGKFSDLDSACPDRSHCPTSNQSTADSANSMATLTNIFLIGGGVVAATGVTLIVLGKPDGGSSDSARMVVTPTGGPGMLGLHASGRFLEGVRRGLGAESRGTRRCHQHPFVVSAGAPSWQTVSAPVPPSPENLARNALGPRSRGSRRGTLARAGADL